MPWFDTHCHLDFGPFNTNFEQHYRSFREQDLDRFVVPAVSKTNWEQVIKLKRYPGVEIALGCHPCFLPQTQADLEHELNALAGICQQNIGQICAIGETGIDGRYPESISLQTFAFDTQIRLAGKLGLPLIVHSVRNHALTHQLLKANQFEHGGIVHAFSGSYQQAMQFINLGFKIGIGGTITWPRAQKTIKAVARLPIESLVLETDAPDMPLFNMQGEANTPLNLKIVFETLARIRNEPSEQLQRQLWENSLDVFNLSEE